MSSECGIPILPLGWSGAKPEIRNGTGRTSPVFQSYVALLLTTGEFIVGIFLVVHDGAFALYLAVTHLVRETSGGKHLHTRS